MDYALQRVSVSYNDTKNNPCVPFLDISSAINAIKLIILSFTADFQRLIIAE